MKFYDENGNAIYLYKFSSYEEEFWMFSTNKCLEQELKLVVESLQEQYESDAENYHQQTTDIYNDLKNHKITEEEYETEISKLDTDSPHGKEYNLKQTLKERFGMQELEPEQSINAHWAIW